MPVPVHYDGKDLIVDVYAEPDGYVRVTVSDIDGATARFPKLTPFEAGMLARELSRAAEKADSK